METPICSAIASSGLVGSLLTAIGYTTATAFDTAVTNGIYNITCLVPLIGFATLGIVLKFVYPLSKARVTENTEIFFEKHGQKNA